MPRLTFPALLCCAALSPALAAPAPTPAYDLSVAGWVSKRGTHLMVQVNPYGPLRHTSENLGGSAPFRNLARLLPLSAPNLNVICKVGSQTLTVRTDQEGHARCNLATSGAVKVSLENGEEVTPDIPTLPDAPITVISDLDDTVLITGVPQGRAFSTFLKATVSNRVAFPDIAPLYNSFAAKGWPIVYLSNSPLGLADFLREVLPARGLPTGPLVLRPLDWQTLRQKILHKTQALNELAADLPGPFLLIGDTGEQDPEVYTAFAKAHPGKVVGIALRDVAGITRRAAVNTLTASAGVPVVVSQDAADFASLVR